MSDLFRDYMTTALADDEILTEVRLPSSGTWSWGYEKFSRRAEDWAMVGVCALVKERDGQVEDARIAFTSMGRTPVRAATCSAMEPSMATSLSRTAT